MTTDVSCDGAAVATSHSVTRRSGFLTSDQCRRMHSVLDMVVSVDSQYGYASIRFTLREYLETLRRRLSSAAAADNLSGCQLKLNGGAAAYVVHSHQPADGATSSSTAANAQHPNARFFFNDFDIVIDDSVAASDETRWDKARDAIFDSLTEVAERNRGGGGGGDKGPGALAAAAGDDGSTVGDGAYVNRIPPEKTLRSIVWDAYVSSSIRVSTQTDLWALICFSNKRGQNLEIKYVQRMKRQYQFSADSFHIDLNRETLQPRVTSSSPESGERAQDTDSPPPNKILVESVYGNYEEALLHLKNKQIVTRRPEEIRGGGLLRYCQLLVNGFSPVASTRRSEPYMCVRFLIDYPTIDKQQRRLMDYISRHFITQHDQQPSNLSPLPPICDWLCRLKTIMGSVPGINPHTISLVSEMAQTACYAASSSAVFATNTAAAVAAAASHASRAFGVWPNFYRNGFGPPPPPPPPPPSSSSSSSTHHHHGYAANQKQQQQQFNQRHHHHHHNSNNHPHHRYGTHLLQAAQMAAATIPGNAGFQTNKQHSPPPQPARTSLPPPPTQTASTTNNDATSVIIGNTATKTPDENNDVPTTTTNINAAVVTTYQATTSRF